MKSWSYLVFSILAIFFHLNQIAAQYTCNLTVSCPEEAPCCSQYGTCGTGSYCLGGCDIQYSFNLSSCMPMPIMSDFNITLDLTDILRDQTTYLGNTTDTDWVYTGYVDQYDGGVLIQMPDNTTGTVISSTKYLWYGRVLATMRTSRTAGVVTAFILFSDVKDELDYEFVGADLETAQTNFYYQGVLNYTNSRNASASDTFENTHLYELDWSEEKTDWLIDGVVVRTLNRADTWDETAKRYYYPQTPSRIQISLWPAGSSLNGVGTIAWAGGAINWDSEDIKKYGYFYAYLENVSFKSYDLPSGVKLSGISKASDANVYVFNLTDGNQENVMLAKKKTWLGSSDATGFDQQNEDKNVTTVILLGLTTFTKTSTKTASINTGNNNIPTTEASTYKAPITTDDQGHTVYYNLSEGFVQDFNNKNGTSSLSALGNSNSNDYISSFSALIIGFISILL